MPNQILNQTLNPQYSSFRGPNHKPNAKPSILVFQRSDEPTRRVYVTKDLEGDREFAGFAGEGDAGSFAGTVVVSSGWLLDLGSGC